MPKAKQSSSAEKLLQKIRRIKYERNHRTVMLKKEQIEDLKRIAEKENLRSVKEAVSVAIESYRSSKASGFTSPRPTMPSRSQAPPSWKKLPFFNSPRVARCNKSGSKSSSKASACTSPRPAMSSGSQAPRSWKTLPFFNSPRVARCNKSGSKRLPPSNSSGVPRFKRPDGQRPKCHRSLNDAATEGRGTPVPDSVDMYGVEPILDSDEEATNHHSRRSTMLQGPSSTVDESDFNISVDCIEKGDFVYPQERTADIEDDDDDDETWHPFHKQNRSMCKTLRSIRADEEVFGEMEKEEAPEITCSGLHHKETSASAASKTKLFLATKTMLVCLAKEARPTCSRCSARNAVDVAEAGTSAHVIWTCEKGHASRLCMQETVNGSHVGDMKLASSILLSGNNFWKVKRLADFMDLHMFSSRLFHAMQSHYVCPVIEAEFDATIKATRTKLENKEIVVCGDARNDSPGFCAQYCTYTLLDHDTKEIVSAEFLDKRETKDRSGGMEPEGLIRALKSLKDGKIKVREVVTDAHPTISAIIKKDYPEIAHSWDIWHGAKNIGKKISKASTVAANRALKKWTKKVVTHFWFCAETCEGNAQLFLSKWRGLVHHVTNKHDWGITGGLGGVAHCEHKELDEEEKVEWLTSGTKAHDALVKIVLDKRFLNTLIKYINFRHTGELESLHSHILMYCSKRFSFGYQAYRARNMLAMIDYSKHKDRPIATDAEGQPMCRSKWSKHSADWVVFEVRERKEYAYIPAMMEEILNRRLLDSLPLYRPADPLPNDPRSIRPRLAPIPPPPIQELRDRRRSRFSQQTL